MIRSLNLVVGGLLSFSMMFSAWQVVSGINPAYENETDELALKVNQDNQLPCPTIFQELPIPDDGSWLTICLLDPSAPEKSTVTDVNVEYILDHPYPEQLEVHISRLQADPGIILWEGGKLVAGNRLGEAINLDAFEGTSSQGEWYISVRDTVPGQTGWLRGATVQPFYVVSNPALVQISGPPGQLTSRRIPPGSMGSTSPDMDEKKPEPESQNSLLEPDGFWQVVKNESFEGAFPNSYWSVSDDNPNDGREYFWDDDDYRPHASTWAAWPANGGANGLDPASSNYPPNMNSWMVYGPINLSSATAFEVSFWMWRQIQPNLDTIFFGVSHDGGLFDGISWSGDANWQEYGFRLDQYTGDDSVWVAWQFGSNGSIEYEGAWVDDILIRKYIPGQVTVLGTLYHYDRTGSYLQSSTTWAYLYDDDPGGIDDLLAETSTQEDGDFQFLPQRNWDEDDPDPDVNNRRLDTYVVFETKYNDGMDSWHRVTNFTNQTYKWTTQIETNNPDGNEVLLYFIQSDDLALPAMWIFQDLRRAWKYVDDHTYPAINPGLATVRWENFYDCYPFQPPLCGSFFYVGTGEPFIFLSNQQRNSSDTVVHETGHHYMWNATGWWLWWDISCYIHQLFSQEDAYCGWSEGWADFLPLVVNGDSCYDFGIGHCGDGGGAFENLETRNRSDVPPQYPWGDSVEGRVAGALYDIYDYANDGYDSAAYGFDPIADIVFQGPVEDRFTAFWESWKTSGQNKHHAVRAIFQNTIDYDTSPRFEPPPPDIGTLQSTTYPHALDLWAYSQDDESNDAELTYQITNVSDWRCGVSLDGHWVNLAPQYNWLGFCDVTVQVSDSIKQGNDTFRVSIVPVTGRVYLPITQK
jgi:subtilisin-like proprotein convertase family protein